MKKINILGKWVFLLLIPFFSSCEFEYPTANVNPDLGFSESGLLVYNTNSEYNSAIATVTISRTFGLSKEIEMILEIDPALVTEYNAIYSSSYTVMDSKYFSVPNTVTFPPNTKEVDIPVVLNPNALVKDLGYDAANNVILPIKLVSANITADLVQNSGSVLLNPMISAPLITVDISASSTLSFLTSVPIVQKVTILSTANFNTVDVSKVSFVMDESKVDEFNTVNETDYVILPSGYYTIHEDVFDSETMEMTTLVDFDCSTLDDSKTYLLPLLLEQTATYGISQEEPIYIVVTLTDLRVWPTEGGNLVNIGGGQGSISLRVNSPLQDDLEVTMYYDGDEIEVYNTTHGTLYGSIDASKINLQTGVIAAGSLTGSLSYSLDINDLGYDDGNEYLIPLTIDESKLTSGAQVTDKPTVYLKLLKTITGNYAKQELEYVQHEDNSQNRSSRFNTLIKLADGTSTGFPKSTTGKNQKYAINYDTSWGDGLLYFNLETEEMTGKPGCHRLIDFQDRPQGYDPINDHGSYFDTNTGNIYFNISILGYWNTSEINVRLYDRTDM